MPYYYGIDMTYIVLVLPAVIIALLAQYNVKRTFSHYSKGRIGCGMTGSMAARRILDANGLHNIKLERVSGSLTDHYDPRAGVIRLSDDVFDVATPAAVGVASHEAGHAIQHAIGYAPIKLRTAIIPICNIGSNLAMPLIVLGLALSFPGLAYVGVAAFGLATLFQLVTLPVEFNASRRAAAILEGSGYFSNEETRGVRKVLSAAALTYVAALAVSLANLLRLLIIVGRRDNRNDK